jgi:hypothetical protein
VRCLFSPGVRLCSSLSPAVCVPPCRPAVLLPAPRVFSVGRCACGLFFPERAPPSVPTHEQGTARAERGQVLMASVDCVHRLGLFWPLRTTVPAAAVRSQSPSAALCRLLLRKRCATCACCAVRCCCGLRRCCRCCPLPLCCALSLPCRPLPPSHAVPAKPSSMRYVAHSRTEGRNVLARCRCVVSADANRTGECQRELTVMLCFSAACPFVQFVRACVACASHPCCRSPCR